MSKRLDLLFRLSSSNFIAKVISFSYIFLTIYPVKQSFEFEWFGAMILRKKYTSLEWWPCVSSSKKERQICSTSVGKALERKESRNLSFKAWNLIFQQLRAAWNSLSSAFQLFQPVEFISSHCDTSEKRARRTNLFLERRAPHRNGMCREDHPYGVLFEIHFLRQ